MPHSIPGWQIDSNVVEGMHPVGATFVPDVAGGPASVPTLTADVQGSVPFLYSMSIPQDVPGAIVNLTFAPRRKVLITKIWLVKTGTAGVAGDFVSVSAGVAFLLRTFAFGAPVANGDVMTGTAPEMIAPSYMEIDPLDPSGMGLNVFTVQYTCGGAGTDTRSLLFILCECSGGV